MMSIKEFSEYVCKGVKAGLPSNLAEAEVSIVYGKDRCSQIQINLPQSNAVVRYALTFDYGEYLLGNCTPEAVVINILNNQNLYHVPIDYMDVFDFDSIKNRIVSRIINGGPHNTEYLNNRPVKYLEGTQFAMIWDISVDTSDKDDILARIPVTLEMLHAWGISVSELEEIAWKNTPLLCPVQIIPINQVLRDNGIEMEDCPDTDILVVSNLRKLDGAITAFYPGVRETLMDMLGDDVYIIPSSIHECIAIAKGNAEIQELYESVCEINKTVVDVNDFLADDVLEYTADGRLVSALRNQTEEQQIREDSIFI